MRVRIPSVERRARSEELLRTRGLYLFSAVPPAKSTPPSEDPSAPQIPARRRPRHTCRLAQTLHGTPSTPDEGLKTNGEGLETVGEGLETRGGAIVRLTTQSKRTATRPDPVTT